MSKAEMQELLDLRGWSKTQLAVALDITENAVYKWFNAGEAPGGPATILLTLWLKEAREAKAASTTAAKRSRNRNGHKEVSAR